MCVCVMYIYIYIYIYVYIYVYIYINIYICIYIYIAREIYIYIYREREIETKREGQLGELCSRWHAGSAHPIINRTRSYNRGSPGSIAKAACRYGGKRLFGVGVRVYWEEGWCVHRGHREKTPSISGNKECKATQQATQKQYGQLQFSVTDFPLTYP